MKKHSVWRATYQSFYSMDLYRDVARHWGAGVVLYLLLILSLSWALSSIVLQQTINHTYSAYSKKIVPQLPVIKVRDGIVSTPENRPYFIKLDDDQHHEYNFMVIDTSGTYKTLESAKASVLVTKNTVYYEQQENSERIMRIPKSRTMDFDPVEADNGLKRLVHWSWVVFFPVLLFLSFIYRLIQAVVYALLGKLFAIASRISLPYSVILKLSIVAMTPAVAISTVFYLLNMSFQYEWLLCFIVSMIYLSLAIRANK